jgi:hypothetical protein
VIFRMDKTGNNYTILRAFTASTGDAQSPKAGLLYLGNGLFYGTSEMGGDSGLGSIFTLTSAPPSPRILAFATGQTNSLQCAGTYATTYDFQRSPNLTSWTNLSTVVPAYDGKFTCNDTNPPPGAAFYRLHQH